MTKIVNMGEEDVWLQPKSRIGIVRPVQVLQSDTCSIHETHDGIHLDNAGLDEVTVNTASTEKPPADDSLPFNINLDDAQISREEREQLGQLLKKYEGVFSKADDDLGFTTTITHF